MNDEFELPDGSYSVPDIQNYIEYIIKKLEGLSTNPRKVYSHNAPFTQAATKAIDAEISKLLQKVMIKPSIHEQGEYIFPIFVTTKSAGRGQGID